MLLDEGHRVLNPLQSSLQIPVAKKCVRKYSNGFEIHDTFMGQPDGKMAKPGNKVTVKYVGKLQANGKVFDQTKGNKTFKFRLGEQQDSCCT